jgi:predicted nucleic acid-binding protein
MNNVVCDASVVVKLLIPEEDSARAKSLSISNRMIAPELIVAEVGNVIWAKLRFAILDDHIETIVENFQRLPLDIRPTRRLLPRALSIATALGHPIYDCFYLALAESLRVPLVTADNRFISAVRRAQFSDIQIEALADCA